MKNNGVAIVVSLTGMYLLVSGWAFADDSKTQVKGMIMSRTGETLVVNGRDGKFTVILTDDTRTKDDRGLFGLDNDELADTVLIPGLKVKVDGTSDSEGRVTAKTITVDGDDLETAEMIQSGLHPTADQVATNMQMLATHQQDISTNRDDIAANQQNISANKDNIAQNQTDISANRQNITSNRQQIEQNIQDIQATTDRFSQLDDYDVKGEATLKFPVGSSTLSKDGIAQLTHLAETAKGITGYIVEVKGFADSTGNALMNEKLSEERAKRVIAFLIQQGGIPVRHVVAPGAMGEYQPAASNETKKGRAENRRVEVKILVNKGIAGA